MLYAVSLVSNLDILEPTRADTFNPSQLFEFDAGMQGFPSKKFEPLVTSMYVIV